jgi:hypothetical protein
VRSQERLALTVLAVLAVAACGGTGAASRGPDAQPSTPAPTASATTTDEAQTSTPESTPAGSVTVPSLGADTPLVDVLPMDLGGAPTQKLAFVGSDLSALDGSTAMVFTSLMNVLGGDDADMTIGAASNANASVIAIRVAGRSAEEIGNAMILGRTLNATTTKDELELGGKSVIKVTTTIAPVPFYVYGSGDVSFTIAATDETIVAEALSKLP